LGAICALYGGAKLENGKIETAFKKETIWDI
jgi:hypothetical protein